VISRRGKSRSVLFDEYLDEVHLPVLPFCIQRIVLRMLARLGWRRGYGSTCPEYERPLSTGYPRPTEP